jgi:hypothetical protein
LAALAAIALDELGREVVFGDRDERVRHGDARLGAFAAVAGSPSSPIVASLYARVLDYAERQRGGQREGDGAADCGDLFRVPHGGAVTDGDGDGAAAR